METYNYYFNRIIEKIMRDNDMREVIYYLSPGQIYQLNSYLGNQMYYPLTLLVSSTINIIPTGRIINPSEIVPKIIFFNELARSKELELKDILFVVNNRIIFGGNNKELASNIIMKGLTTTLRSIIDRPVDKDKIDSNLKKGASERKEYSEYLANKHQIKYSSKKHRRTKHRSKNQSQTINLAEPLTTIEKPDHIISEVSVHPNTEGKHKLHKYSENKKLPADQTIRDYRQGVDILNNLDPIDPLDKQLSPPLDEPPVGTYGSTVITTSSHSVIPE